MNNLQLVEKDGEMLVDSRDVAVALGIEHRSLIRSINVNISEIEEFGALRFQIAVKKDNLGGEQPKYALLNEDQALFVGTLCRNSKEVIAYKAWLVRGFQAARKILMQPARQLTNIELAEMFIQSEKRKIELERINSEKNNRILQLEHKNEKLYESDVIVKKFLSCDGLLSIEEVAKIACIRLKKFYKIVRGVIYRQDGEVYANLIINGKIVLRPTMVNNVLRTETFFTPAGAVWIYKKFIKGNPDQIKIRIDNLDM